MTHWFLTTLAHLIRIAAPLVHHYGLWGLVGILFAENLGVIFAPGEAMVVTAGFLAAKGFFGIEEVIALAILAAIAGGYASYALGTRLGHARLVRHGRYLSISPKMIERVHDMLRRFGAPILILGRFIVPLRQLQGYLAGSARMGFRPYALWSTVGAALWVVTWGGGAWWLAQSIPG
ncbi:MAG: DedA family protein [Gammaproteobacteria bacterium]|nr:DedA family protein [Gammaproteobacteria bacterium]